MSNLQSNFVLLLTFVSLVFGANGVSQRNAEYDHGVDLPTTRPLVIAHRGSSGTLPEHTVAAYQLAVDQGADVVECDVTISKDLTLLCSHEAWLNATTDIADRFNESRMNRYFIPSQVRFVTDFFSVDFTMEELRTVRKKQRMDFRDPNYDGQFPIATLEELIGVVKGAGRPVGIYVETKDPDFINSLEVIQSSGKTFEDLLLEELDRFGYNTSRSPCFLQSFNENSLRYMADRSPLPAVMLVGGSVSDDDLTRYSGFAYGIGPNKGGIVRTNRSNQIEERTDLVERAHNLGLRVHPYTLRNENQYLAWDYGQDPYREYAEFFNTGVDGIFTDFPGTYFTFLNQTYSTCEETSEASRP